MPEHRVRPSRVALAVGALLSLAAGGAYWWARGTLPPLDGEFRLVGLTAPVEVQFDAYGIPHVYARDAEDAWMAAGYLQARDRLWQMELYRRAASGRLAEVFGEDLLPADRRFRTLGLRSAAAAEWTRATPRARSALERYAVGVNAAIRAAGTWRLPIEFRVIGGTPEAWTPIDSLSVGKLLSWRLSENFQAELVRGALARGFGAAEAARLMGDPPGWAPTIVTPAEIRAASQAATTPENPPDKGVGGLFPMLHGRSKDTPDPFIEPDPLLEAMPPGLAWLDPWARRGASNSWVVAGSRTTTGRPLLANDPHLAVEMPSIWYEMHLVARDLDVIGAAISGSPFVIIGHNRRIAWGLTNTGADVQDGFVERVDWSAGKYLHRGVWQPLRIERHEIAVRGRARPEILEVALTVHGPIVADELAWVRTPPGAGSSPPVRPARPIALAWDSVRRESAGAFEAINRAGSWAEFTAASEKFLSPSQNFVYADVEGNIGYVMSGLLPARPAGDGSALVPGWTGESDWSGPIEPATLPRALNPASGQIVTANNEVVRGWARVITRDWAAPFRAARIIELLGDRRGLDVAAFSRIQLDVTSRAAELLLAPVERAAAGGRASALDATTRAALDRLRLWDRRVDGRPATSLYEAFEQAMWRRTFADEMDPDLFRRFYNFAGGERYAGLYAIVDDPRSRWFDDIGTIDRRETRDDIVALAAGDALGTLRGRFGAESQWAWDRLHAVRFRHSLAAGSLALDWLFSRGPVAVPGDGTTLNKTSVNRREPYGTTEVASYRQIVDVGGWDNTVAVSTAGQSGNPLSPHYFDQNPLWRDGRYHPVPFTRRAVEAARASKLLLLPEVG